MNLSSLDPIFLFAAISSLLLFICLLMQFFVLRKVNALSQSNAKQIKLELVGLSALLRAYWHDALRPFEPLRAYR
jgi:DNA recombination protein RmuC